MKQKLFLLAISSLLVFALVAIWGCDNDVTNGDGGTGPVTTDMTCIGCHGDKDMLLANIDEEAAKVGVPNKGDG